MYRNILLENQEIVMDYQDRVQYQFYYRAIGSLGFVAIAAFLKISEYYTEMAQPFPECNLQQRSSRSTLPIGEFGSPEAHTQGPVVSRSETCRACMHHTTAVMHAQFLFCLSPSHLSSCVNVVPITRIGSNPHRLPKKPTTRCSKPEIECRALARIAIFLTQQIPRNTESNRNVQMHPKT